MEENEMENIEFEIEEEKQAERIVYGESDTVSKMDVTPFYDKNNLLGREKIFTIRGVGKNKFNKPFLEVTEENDNLTRILNINKLIFNELIESFGNRPAAWVGRTVAFRGMKFEKVSRDRKTNTEKLLSGVQLTLVK